MRDISLHLMDIMQNSITAKASKVTIVIEAYSEYDSLLITVSDNGMGMGEELLSQVTNPFVTTRSTRKVGLGISLLRASAERAGGQIEISSKINEGTTLKASFEISNIDRIPLGDISQTIISMIAANPDKDFELLLESSKGNFRVDTAEIKEKLGEVPVNNFEIITWIKEFIDEGIKITFGGVLNEINS